MRCSRRTPHRAKRRSARPCPATCAAAPGTSRSSRLCSWLPRGRRKMGSVPDLLGLGAAFRYIGKKRRTKEDPRFVTGRGRYVADVALPGLKHVAILASPHASALIKRLDTRKALALPGVHYVLTGEEFCAATDPLLVGVDAPLVKRWALARGRVRYAGEWVAAVVADSRALAEDALEAIEIEYAPADCVLDPEQALLPGAPLVHPEHGSNVLYRCKFVWGPVEEDFARAQHRLALKLRWARSATVPIET